MWCVQDHHCHQLTYNLLLCHNHLALGPLSIVNPKYCLSCQKIGEDKTDFIFHNYYSLEMNG